MISRNLNTYSYPLRYHVVGNAAYNKLCGTVVYLCSGELLLSKFCSGGVGAPATHGGIRKVAVASGICRRRFAHNGGVEAKDFQRMWREMGGRPATTSAVEGGVPVVVNSNGGKPVPRIQWQDGGGGGNALGAEKSFEVRPVESISCTQALHRMWKRAVGYLQSRPLGC